MKRPKILRNNFFNQIFRSNSVLRCVQKAHNLERLWRHQDRHLEKLNTINSLPELLKYHKYLWDEGYRCDATCPNRYGMFRTDDIMTMRPEDVYLGGIWGLSTNNIPFWENARDEMYGENGFCINPDMPIYTLILNQYKNMLRSAVLKVSSCSKMEHDLYVEYGY